LSIDPLVAQPTLCGSDNAIRLLACDPTRILANNSYARSDSRDQNWGHTTCWASLSKTIRKLLANWGLNGENAIDRQTEEIAALSPDLRKSTGERLALSEKTRNRNLKGHS